MLARDEFPLKRTPLHALHVARGGKLVAFAGYEMPVQYPAGVLREHLHTRSAAGLFDVSHMGQLALRPKSGRVADAALALERLVPQDIVAVAQGRQRYAQFTREDGGILDDLMVANLAIICFWSSTPPARPRTRRICARICPIAASSNRFRTAR